MNALDDSEKNAKVSDSAYSNSCSNSQSRRSHSSKSTHSGSNSSGSSGYGGKPSTSGCSFTLSQSQKREKETKKKKSQTEVITDVQTETETIPPETVPEYVAPKEDNKDVVKVHTPTVVQVEKGPENMDVSLPEQSSANDEVKSCHTPKVSVSVDFVTSRPPPSFCNEGFSCVISMDDGVVMYTTNSLTSTLGFPKDMWIGRSFIDFVHPRDRSTFAAQITNNLAVPKIVNGAQEKARLLHATFDSSMICRIRRYRGLAAGFGVKDRVVTFMPFLLKFTFKNITDDDVKAIYLVLQATPFFSAFKVPNELMSKGVLPFVIRHAANGYLEYIDPESVPYLGYLPQDVTEKDALQMYHPEDLNYLLQVYEAIVKEGGVLRSKPYRIMAQNGDYIKVETEWSSFINPWSRKLEFVIGKHHVIEGPNNPDVFQSPDPEKAVKLPEEEKNKANKTRESIVRIMNDVLTKPAGVAKQQMSKRCRELASFMESLMEEQPKPEDEFRLEIQDPDPSYERDSVMLGGISPHHDYNDSKSSTETPLSYNQLNYNETLHRYFDSHQQHSYEDCNMATDENALGSKDMKPSTSKCVSPLDHSGESGEMTSSCESSALAVGGASPVASHTEYQHVRLTESLLNKHNAEMEKELMKLHKEIRSGSKGTREKVYNENKKKKKEHLARCNASYQHTALATYMSVDEPNKCHGVKRTMNHDSDPRAQKFHCPTPRPSKRKNVTTAGNTQPLPTTVTTAIANNSWATTPVNTMGTFLLGVGIPQQMSIMTPVPAAIPGVFPVYYPPTCSAGPTESAASANSSVAISTAPNTQFTANTVQCMVYGQPVYGSPFVYSPMHQIPYSMQQGAMIPQSMQTETLNPLGLATDTYEETCKSSITIRSSKSSNWQEKKRTESARTSSKQGQDSVDSNSSNNALNRSNMAVPGSSAMSLNSKKIDRLGNSEETVDRTDGESSYSSFYSSFFKTESGSAEESSEAKKNLRPGVEFLGKTRGVAHAGFSGTDIYSNSQQDKKVAKRKMEPPWMEQVCVTSELVYKYQIITKSMDEVLLEDKKKMKQLEQPSLVNEQLGQLYVDLQLEGVAARLTLEEGVTSSSSSSDDTSKKMSPKNNRKKRAYSKLVMIYEEDAPLPPPTDGQDHAPSPSLPT